MRLFYLLAAVGVVACSEPTHIEYAAFVAPAAYDTLWAQVEKCSGLTRPPVTRYGIAFTETVDGFWSGNVWAGGAYILNADRIVLAPHVVMAWIPEKERNAIVRHEMLHAHLMPLGIMEHPREYFVEKCGALVDH